MPNWEKKNVAKEVVMEIHNRYKCDMLTASILARRNITTGSEILYYLEDDKRYLHSPFLFNTMEDAVDRILDAKDEGEKVLIFGDRDVDGITSTTLLYQYLTSIGIDVQYKLPTGNDSYGLSIKAIDDFAANYGTLIITVDCGISNNDEIAHAAELGIDVIVVDHHNAPGDLPEPAIIVNPKIQECGYPFKDISGCAVVYKLVTALRFAKTELYKQEICLMNVRPINDAYVVECIKIQNMVEKERLSETFIPGMLSIQQTRLVPFLKGQQIFVWDGSLQKKSLEKIFGPGVEFNMLDIRPEIAALLPSVGELSLLRIKGMSRIALYQDTPTSEIDGFFNLFITFIQKKTANEQDSLQEEKDLQLVMLAAIADIMPLVNENRILVKQGLASINKGKIRSGLLEILGKQNLLGKKLGSTDFSWNVIPLLNAAGRIGKPEIALQLFLEQDPKERDALADKIIAMNIERRQLGTDAWGYAEPKARESLEKYDNKLAVVIDERIHRGVTGIVAGKLAQYFKVPAMVMTFPDENKAVGSMRSVRGYDVTGLLEQCGDLFINHGGHNYAAGFSLPKSNLQELTNRLERLCQVIEFTEEENPPVSVDAELPAQYMTPDLLQLVDKFEPYGEANPQLIFMSNKTKIASADLMGKTGKMHLKLTLSFGATKWPALYWSASERLKRDFDVGDKIDLIYQINRNTYNGSEIPQIIITDAEKSE